MKIAFVGTVLFSKVTLQHLIKLNAEIVGVVTKDQSLTNSDFENLSDVAIKHNIPYKYVNDINHENNIEWIRSLKPDVIFCFGWSSLLKQELIKLAPMGVIGYHPSLLPENRGRHPLIWAKILGLSRTGSTFFFMDEGADTGDILSQEEIEISFDDNASTLYKKAIDTAIQQISEFLPKLAAKNIKRIPQNKELGNNWRKRSTNDGLIDFRMCTTSICNLVRGLSHPYFGAHCIFNGKEIKVWDIELCTNLQKNIEPGKVLAVLNNLIEVKTGDGSVLLKNHEFKELPLKGEYIL